MLRNEKEVGALTGEQVLMQRARKGEIAAFETIVTAYERKIYALALRSTGSEADAADITQEVFLRAWKSMGKFRGDSSVSTWLYRITMNLCVDHARRKNIQAVPLTDEEGTELPLPDTRADNLPEAALEGRELSNELQTALGMLTDEHRQIILLRDVSGLSYQEIGRLLTLEEGTVKSRLARARRNLREILIKRGNISLPSASKYQERRQENG